MEIGRIYLFVFSASLTTRLLVKTNLFSCVIVSFGFSLSHNTFYMKQFHRRPTVNKVFRQKLNRPGHVSSEQCFNVRNAVGF